MKTEKSIAFLVFALAVLAMPAYASETSETITNLDTGEKLTIRTGEPSNDGRTTVETSYAEGELAGKCKRNETFSNGKLVDTMLYFYNADGEEVRTVNLWSKSELARWKARGRDTDGMRMFVQHRDKLVVHNVIYKDSVLDNANEMAIPDPLPPIPATSGYDTKNIALAAALSDDGKSILITLKNISDSPVEVDKGDFDAPLITLGWSSDAPIDGHAGSYWPVPMRNMNTVSARAKSSRPLTSLAPGESLHYTATIKEIFQKFRDFHKHLSPTEINFADTNPAKTEIRISNVTYQNLFPLPPDANRVQTTVRPETVSLGTVEEFKKKHPGIIRKP